ncbi:class II aaRS and biotin synthetase [Teratosphaeria nubilosa]|uniref:Lysyl-tRNA synthetase n=1 Tax=Teratosphaeria nubilosa TaxID=161662 RepID=A0A6G1KZU8_9PEZI|nr:class II aaRS and biotin synthetase [Teratosphaeria nubilosa]
MAQPIPRRLRPYLFHGFRSSQHAPARRTFFAAHVQCQRSEKAGTATHDYEKRVGQLQADKPVRECYPRLPERFAETRQPLAKFRKLHETMVAGQTVDEVVTVVGRISSVRTAGSKLVFLDISDDPRTTLQAVCQLSKISPNEPPHAFKSFTRTARKGDWFSVTGHPHRTERGELSVLATTLPQLLSPSLHQIPETLDDPETKARKRHIDSLVNPSSLRPLLVRHHIEKHLGTFLDTQGFIKVNTPILTPGAGGAVARAFETEATELEGQKLNLRIAPELWLKRLVVGGLNKVYEIGPAFRNEGVDATHNPEFSICEFYEAFATLDDLITKTETLLSEMQAYLNLSIPNLPPLPIPLRGPYPRLEFIPTLESALNHALPDLTSPTAQSDLLTLFLTHVPNVFAHVPTDPTLPRLLDALSTLYLEPLCTHPTYLTHHPAALSPLAKHFTCPRTGQTVSARAELFIQGREYANMYEEENSPFEQRRKFVEQLALRGRDDGEGGVLERKGVVDEGYLAALEWGLPPTGGWGCGVERLVMLFSGKERIAEVLPFGTVRHVGGLGRR